VVFANYSIFTVNSFLIIIIFAWCSDMQAGGFPEPEIVHYNPKDFDFGKKKAFPFRAQVLQLQSNFLCLLL
jgi:hypothetical protein